MADHTPIQAIVNAVKILDVINEKGTSGTREIAKLLNIPKSTVFLLLFFTYYTLSRGRYKAENSILVKNVLKFTKNSDIIHL